jgi:serine/threonine protein kinase
MADVCPLAPTIGETLDGKYQILREVRREPTGVVFEAIAVQGGRRLAIKTLFEATSSDNHLAARCQREARAAGGIGNRNILQVFDSGRSQRGLLFLVTELLDGAPLGAWLQKSLRLPGPLAADVMAQVLGALSSAHQHGVIHRGLTPDSIFVLSDKSRPNSIKLIDFGIPKENGAQASRSSGTRPVGAAAGLPASALLYMSPEQIRGEAVDHRTDIYAAGAILYQMLCGSPPFQGDDPARLQRDILEGDYPKPRAVRPELSATLETTIVRALERDLRRRFATAAAMRDLLSSRATPAAPVVAVTAGVPDAFVLEPDTVVDARAVDVPASPRLPPPPPPPASPLQPLPPLAPAGGTLDPADVRPLAPPRPAVEPPALKLAMTARARAQARDKGATMAALPQARRRIPWWALLGGVLVVAVVLIIGLRPRRADVATPAPAANAPAHEEIQRFFLRVSPADAKVTIDHLPVSARELPVESGPPRAHEMKVAAPNHLTRLFTFTASPGMELSVRLGHTLPAPLPSDPPPLPAELALDYPEQPRPADEIAQAFARLDRHAACLAAAAAIGPRSSPELFSGEGFLPCRSLVDEPAPAQPKLLALQPAATAYVAAARKGASAETLGRMAFRFRAEFLAERAYWQLQELARIGQDEGRKAAWHMRRVALTAAAWVRARRSGAANVRAVEDKAAKLETQVQALEDYVRGSSQGIGNIRGAEDFRRAAQGLLVLARPKTAARTDEGTIYEACRKLLTNFDALVLD